MLKLLGYPVNKAEQYIQDLSNIGDIENWQNEKKWEIFEYHLRNNEFYSKSIKGIHNWEDIPIMSKKKLQGDHRSKIPSSLLNKKHYISHTSGSSGQPFVFVKDKFTHALTWMNIEKSYNSVGISLSDKQARFYGAPMPLLDFYKERLKDFLMNRQRFIIFDLTDAILKKWVEVFSKNKFKYIYGYTSSILVFSRYLIENNIVLKNRCPTLKCCIVTSEMCTSIEKDIIEKAIGVPVYNEYGASEFGIIGFNKNGNYWNVADEMFYLEVVDEYGDVLENGQEGKLICTSLHNRGTPFIRYEIGDIVIINKNKGKTILTNIIGRTNDIAILPSGKKVPGLSFYYAVHDALVDYEKDVIEHQVVQIAKDYFVVNMVVANNVPLKMINDRLQSVFNKYLEKDLKVEIKKVDQIDRAVAGKFKHFISLI